jgi:hypothetical protein
MAESAVDRLELQPPMVNNGSGQGEVGCTFAPRNQ